MIWLMGNQKTLQKELNQTKSQEIKHLKLRVIKNVMVIKEDLFQWFTSFLIKGLMEVVLLLDQITISQMNFIGRIINNLRDEKFIHLLETITGVLI